MSRRPQTTAATATTRHVAGPVEKERHDSAAGWRWVQRCLSCDAYVSVGKPWFKLGCEVHELVGGRMTSEPTPEQHAGSAARCSPER